MWHSTSHYDMKTAVVTLGGREGGKILSASLQLSDPTNNRGKVCTNGTLKYVHKTLLQPKSNKYYVF